MYLLKQWRESRILTGLAILALVLLLAGTIEAYLSFASLQAHHPDPQQIMSATFAFTLAILYTEAVLVSFWAWLIGSIGIGKSLGEDSGSFLLTRPRSRAWFLWNDWGFAMAQIAAIILITNCIFGFWIERILAGVNSPRVFHVGHSGQPFSLLAVLALISISVLLAAGLIYSISYFSTILLKRSIGVIVGAGIVFAYFILRAVIRHHYGIELPAPLMNMFDFGSNTSHGFHAFHGIAGNLGINILARAAVMLAFPFAAQLLLNRAEV